MYMWSRRFDRTNNSEKTKQISTWRWTCRNKKVKRKFEILRSSSILFSEAKTKHEKRTLEHRFTDWHASVRTSPSRFLPLAIFLLILSIKISASVRMSRWKKNLWQKGHVQFFNTLIVHTWQVWIMLRHKHNRTDRRRSIRTNRCSFFFSLLSACRYRLVILFVVADVHCFVNRV